MKTIPSSTLDELPGSLPPDAVPKDVDLTALTKDTLQLLQNVNPENLVHDAMWKDWLCLTGRIQTYNGANKITKLWKRVVTSKNVTDLKTTTAQPSMTPFGTSWVTVSFTFTATQDSGLVSNCSGNVGIVPVGEGQWKIWFISTILENFEGHGNPDVPVLTRRDSEIGAGGANDFEVIIVGAGQSGLAQAGRLQALGIKYVLLERLPGVGQSWSTKYDTVRQHTIREYNNLPFDRTWTTDDETLLHNSKVVEGFQKYADKYNINAWTSIDVTHCSWNAQKHEWTLKVARNDGGAKEEQTLTSRHLALGLGAGVSQPNIPELPGQEKFQGDMFHMKYFKNSKKWTGKRGVVIGSGTAGHDVAQDMLDNGLSSVTMIQRSKTSVYPVEMVIMAQEGLFNVNIPTSVADRATYAMPMKIEGELMRRGITAYTAANQERFDDLEKAGFQLDKGQVVIDQIVQRYGGYYIDVGTSAEISKGNIKVKSGVPISGFTADGITFDDGIELKADLVVLATGYEHDYRKHAATVVGSDIAEKLDDFWGITKDGDLRGIMTENAPGLWLLGGAIGHARFFSRFTALQMQADLLGKPLVKLDVDGEKKEEMTNGLTNGHH